MTHISSNYYNELLADLDEDTRSILNDIDPDVNLINGLNVAECKYYTEDLFHDMIASNPHLVNNMSLLHLNVRSIPKNFDSLTNYLHSLNHCFDIIGITETWHSSSTIDLYDMPGYKCIHKYRDTRKGGGVTYYIRNNIDYKVRSDLGDLGVDCDTVFIECKGLHANVKHCIVGLIYRPPNTNVPSFTNAMSVMLSKIRSEKKVCYLLGDYNINILKTDCHHDTSEFVNCMLSHSYFPLITKPTRLCNTSQTLIDNIFCSNVMLSKDMVNGILCTDISDHYPVFTILGECNNRGNVTDNVWYRPVTIKGKEIFKSKLAGVNWDDILQTNDVQMCYSRLSTTLGQIYEESFPLKRKGKRGDDKPWLTDTLKQSIKTKNKLYLRYKKCPILHNELKYKVYRNTLRKILILAEKQHYDFLFNECKGDSKRAWGIMKNILGTNKQNTVNKEFVVGDTVVNDGKHIANVFNNCFVNLGPNLASKITDKSNKNANCYLGSPNVNSIFVVPVTENEVFNIITGLKNKSSPGWDGIKTDVIKYVADIIVKPLMYVINLSLESGIVPDEIKIARVVPIYKSGNVKELTNYRPVSVLPCLSKLFERVVYNRLVEFIEKHSILSECQFGFRKKHSTEHCVTLLVDNICKAMDNGNNFVGIFLDLSKAFDTVNHKILLDKLEHYGIRGNTLQWIKHYLTNRKQFVEYNGYKSSLTDIVCGVPQGSILGPLLFLFYINDLPSVSNQLSSLMFADDTNMFTEHRDLEYLNNMINNELIKIVEWLAVNKLSLNVKKTHVMLFTKYKARCNEKALNIYIGGELIQTVTKTVFLGIVIDDKLTWKEHITKLCNKISKGIGIIKKVRYKLQTKTLINLYYAFIYPYLIYCNTIWGNAAKVHMNQLLVLQKRVLRIMYNVKYRDSTKKLYEESKIINVFHLYVYSICIFMFKHFKGLLPICFNDMFIKRYNVHSCNTRSANLYDIILCRTQTHKQSIAYKGPSIFNLLLNSGLIDLHSINSIHYFKQVFKKHIQALVCIYTSKQ